MYSEILEILDSKLLIRDKYIRLYDCLDRMCIRLTEPLVANYNSLYTRLQALCRIYEYPIIHIENFRYTARQIKNGNMEPEEAQMLLHVKALVDAIARFTQTQPPAKLLKRLPDKIELSPLKQAELHKRKKMRCLLTDKDDDFLYAVSEDSASDAPLKINFHINDHTLQTAELMKTGMQFNVVSFLVDKEDIIHPEIMVIEPDYLLEISRLTKCMQPYGSSPFNYLLDKFDLRDMTTQMLMGNVANQFLDDCIYNENADFLTSISKAFHDYVIPFTFHDDIGQDFFIEAERQFNNIKNTIARLREDNKLVVTDNKNAVMLEPSFFCETLGIQGRFDLLSSDGSFLIELKSGKKNEFFGKPKDDHLMQMLLYKDIMYYNLDIYQNKVAGHILYSKYPELIEIRSFKGLTQNIILVRNKIVAMEMMLVDGKAREFLPKLTAEHLLQNRNCTPQLWKGWSKPAIEAVLHPVHSMDEMTADYFYTFLQFIEREQMMEKTGDNRIHSTRSMAALWNADIDLKLENGDIIINLKRVDIRYNEYGAVTAVALKMDDNDDDTPNFRTGDVVVMYQRDNATDNVTNRQIVRAAIEKIERDIIWISLRYPQKNDEIFDASHRFCLEHDHIEASFASLYKSLFLFVVAPEERRRLLLSQRPPKSLYDEKERNVTRQSVDDIVDAADKAQDFFLLVGPPGTGKTSVALRKMVEKFASQGKTLLLMAYTNRAVDEICGMMENTGIDYVRLGKPLATAPQYHHRLFMSNVAGLNNRKQVRAYIDRVNVIVSTVTSMFSSMELLKIKHIDIAIIDEASQIIEPQIIGLLSAAYQGKCLIDKFIMIGDHKQLPAVVVQPSELSEVHSERLNRIGLLNCRNSLFERLHLSVHDDCRFVALLNRQGRMHVDISDFVNLSFYNGVLQPVPLQHQLEQQVFNSVDSQSVISQRVAFVDVPKLPIEQRTHKSNIKEAAVVANIVNDLVLEYHKNDIEFSPENNIGIIVPFRRQITLVTKELRLKGISNVDNMLIDTVERFQGSQKDVIIYSTTISDDYEIDLLSEAVDIEGTLVDRKLNVALTRARKQLFIVGCKSILSKSPIYNLLISSIPNF